MERNFPRVNQPGADLIFAICTNLPSGNGCTAYTGGQVVGFEDIRMPEPATMSLLATGLAGISGGTFLRRRNKA